LASAYARFCSSRELSADAKREVFGLLLRHRRSPPIGRAYSNIAVSFLPYLCYLGSGKAY
jgi:hypothetical protein